MRFRAHAIEPSQPVPLEADPPFRADYADAFQIYVVANERTAIEWASASLEEAPAALRGFVTFVWRYGIWLRLRAKGEAQCVAGWPILLDTPETVVLGVDSALLGRARLTFEASGTAVTASSHISFERRGGRAVWSVVGILHRRILPYMLGHAASSR